MNILLVLILFSSSRDCVPQVIAGLVFLDTPSYPALTLSETVKSDRSFRSVATTESKRASALLREGPSRQLAINAGFEAVE
jgi:hypothetical protein